MAKRIVDEASLTGLADDIRAKGGTTEPLVFPDGFRAAVNAIQTGGGSSPSSVSPKDINFYDYDGTVLYSYTVEEAAALTELPALPEHDGLICQGWNWTLADIKAMGRAVNVGAMYITDDGKTRIYITLYDGRTSPMLGCCPNGTVTVDWGDGTEPDVLTGTSTSTVKWTPNHEYAAPGNYVITLTVDGKMGFYGSSSTNQYSGILRYASGTDKRNRTYYRVAQRVEVGSGVTSIGDHAFRNCYGLASITIPNSVTSIGTNTFANCYSMVSITIPDGVTSISDHAFQNCYSMASITIPDGVTSIGTYTFYCNYGFASITIPNSVTSIGTNTFAGDYGLASITIPNSVTSIGTNTFANCDGLRYYDFTNHTAVPTLSSTSAFQNIAEDCEIRVPAALADEWKAATNWSTYADYIVGV